MYGGEGGSLKDAPIAVSYPIWTGFYAGVNAGALFDQGDLHSKVRKDKFEQDKEYKKVCYGYYCYYKTVYKDTYTLKDSYDISDYFKSHDDDDTTFIGGLHAGYNWQRGNIILGVEGDLDFGDDINYLASARARLGYAHDNWLLYITGGAAFINIDRDLSITDNYGNKFSFSDGNGETGWVAGGGFEKKLRQDVSFGVEGLYYDFGSDSNEHFLESKYGYHTRSDIFADTDRDFNFWSVRARLTYHFQEEAYHEPLK
jgi:outer membrane immunogenic protein